MGSSKKTETSRYIVPKWVEGGAQSAVNLAGKIMDQPYSPYTGQRVAGLTQNEQMGIDLARTSAGQWAGDVDNARSLLGRATERFTDADINAYMNPYLEGYLNPSLRRAREEGAMQLNQLQGMEKSRGSFGFGRSGLLEAETRSNITRDVNEMRDQGYFKAFEGASDRWDRDRQNDMRAAGNYLSLAQNTMNMTGQDIAKLMESGAVQRGVQQMRNDFDYQQFVEGRDWDLRGLNAILETLKGIQGSYGTTQKTTSKNKPSALGQAVGLAATVAGAYFTGGLSLAAGDWTGMMGGGGGGQSTAFGTRTPWSNYGDAAGALYSPTVAGTYGITPNNAGGSFAWGGSTNRYGDWGSGGGGT